MADQLPCPNPMCSHVFTLAELQAAASVGCPRCGFRVQGRGAAIVPRPAEAPKAASPPPATKAAAPINVKVPGKAAPTRPAPASAKPAKVVAPTAPPTSPSAPLARSSGLPGTAAAEFDVDLVDAPAVANPVAPVAPIAPVAPTAFPVSHHDPFAVGSLSTPGAASAAAPVKHRAGGKRTLLRALVVIGAFGFAFCIVPTVAALVLSSMGFFAFDDLWTGQVITRGPRNSDYVPFLGNARNVNGKDEKAFRLLLAKSWAPDRELKAHLGALGAWRNKEDDLWLAIAVKDYGVNKPRDAEMLQQGIERLEGHFGESLELGAKAEPTRFAGEPAQKLTFKGQLGAVVSWGECLMFSHHGLAYWVFLAGPSLDELQTYEAELKKEETGFAVASDRKGWREQPPRSETFTGSDGRVSMTAPEGVWEKFVPATAEFETGKLLLLGKYLKEKDNQKNAHLQVFTLDKESDLKAAIKQARDYLEKQKKEQNSGYKIGPAAEGQSDLGVVEDVGNRPGRVAELQLSLNETAVRYYLLAVVSEPDQLTVVLCDCNWKSRQIWRQDFLELLKTLRIRAKAA